MTLTSVEICAGAGGQALGLEQAGFEHTCLVEIDSDAVATLRMNRPRWNVHQADLLNWQPPKSLERPDLLAGGVPCPPFSLAGKQLGPADDRNLFPRAIELTEILNPRAVMLENVRGIMGRNFADYRSAIVDSFIALGYRVSWELVTSADFGVPQLRPRAVLVALKDGEAAFEFPSGDTSLRVPVGPVLRDEMASLGWEGATEWAESADAIAPTLVGGSKKHGGADLGPTRARQAWERLGVDGRGLADTPPVPGFVGLPRLTVSMAALVQGFPTEWRIAGRKTSAYRQVGNAFPPPVAKAIGTRIAEALNGTQPNNAESGATSISRFPDRQRNFGDKQGGRPVKRRQEPEVVNQIC